MASSQKIKKYFWYFFGIIGVIFFWAGIWDGLGSISYLQIPWVSLLVGLAMTVLGIVMFKQKSIFDKTDTPRSILEKLHFHPEKHKFKLSYMDKLIKKEISFSAKKIKGFEKGFLILVENNKEIFIPHHRVTKILHKGKPYSENE